MATRLASRAWCPRGRSGPGEDPGPRPGRALAPPRPRPEPPENRVGRAAALGSLANLAYQRFLDARAAGADTDVLVDHLNTALRGHRAALDLLPADHHDYRATAHHQIGVLYAQAGDVPQAMRHYQQSLHHQEARGNRYGAAHTRDNIALLLAAAGRPRDALLYAQAARDTYTALGTGAADRAQRAADLIHRLEHQARDAAPAGWGTPVVPGRPWPRRHHERLLPARRRSALAVFYGTAPTRSGHLCPTGPVTTSKGHTPTGM